MGRRPRPRPGPVGRPGHLAVERDSKEPSNLNDCLRRERVAETPPAEKSRRAYAESRFPGGRVGEAAPFDANRGRRVLPPLPLFGLNGFEFDTAARFGLPIIGVMGNDAAWGQMMRPQGAIYGWDRLAATELAFTRYDKVVEALGGHGELVERPEAIRPALDRAAASGKPALVNVIIRQDRSMKEGAIYV